MRRVLSRLNSSRRTVPVLVLLVVAGSSVLGQGMQATDVPSSECYECHRSGGAASTSAITSVYSLRPPENLRLVPGEPTEFTVVFRNDWTARLDRIAVTLDLERAPSFAFAGAPDPLLGVTRVGTIPFDLETVAAAQKTARLTVPLAEGATAARFRLIPDTTDGATAPDLRFRLWDPHANPQGIAQTEVDDQGAGGTEVFRLRDAGAVALRGTGTWTVEAVLPGLADGAGASTFTDQGFRVVVDAWFNQTGERQNTLNSAARLDGFLEEFPSTELTWTVHVVSPVTEGQAFALRSEATAYYRHPPQFGAIDEWRFKDDLNVPILVPPQANTTQPTTVTLNVTPPPPPPDAGLVVTGAAVGEAFGYFATFLYVSSTIAGGMFGLRRGLNRAFGSARRRIAFHNVVSYLLIAVTILHIVVFLVELTFHWAVGILWGGLATLALFGLGVTGAFQISIIRGWSYGAWRVLHYGLAVLAILLTAVHLTLDGIHFQAVQDAVGWRDPLVAAWGPT